MSSTRVLRTRPPKAEVVETAKGGRKAKTQTKIKKEEPVDDDENTLVASSAEVKGEVVVQSGKVMAPKALGRKAKVKKEADSDSEPIRKRRATVEEGMNEEQRHLSTTEGASVLAASRGSKKLLGFHVSAAGGVEQAVYNAAATGCRAFALFVRNQRQWTAKPMEEETVARFRLAFKEHYGSKPETVLPHGSYLMNAGSPDPEKLEKTRTALLDECQRCEKLGIKFYNFHPGSATDGSRRDVCLRTVAETVDFVLSRTKTVVLVLETMAGQGSTVGGSFEELRAIIDMVKNNDRVGVCIDTCHIFAAGYDIRTKATYERTMEEFGRIVGFDRLKGLHLNDSMGKLGSHLDRHDNIGRGLIGKGAFGFIMNDARLDGIPLILETPEGDYTNEMRLLYGMDEATRVKTENEEEEDIK